MKVTLDLDHVQLTILHTLVGQSGDTAISKKVVEEAQEYSYTDENIFEAYKHTLAYINNHPTYLPFGDELSDLFEKIDNAMTECGKAFKGENK